MMERRDREASEADLVEQETPAAPEDPDGELAGSRGVTEANEADVQEQGASLRDLGEEEYPHS
jgi:hypothetical protein